MTIQFIKGRKTLFKNVEDKQFFFDANNVLYKRIFSQDLKEFGISCVNAVSVINGGLTFFHDDENVYIVTTIKN